MTLDDFDRIVVETYDGIPRIVVETEDGIPIATIDFSIKDEPIKVADGYQVRMRPKTSNGRK